MLVGVVTTGALILTLLAGLTIWAAATDSIVTRYPVRLTAAAPPMDMVGMQPTTAGQWDDGMHFPVEASGAPFPSGYFLDLPSVGPTAAVLASAPSWTALLAAAILGFLLLPVLRTTASGASFPAGNGARLSVATAVAAGAWAASIVLPWMASGPAIDAAASGGGVPAGWLAPRLEVSWWPLPVILLFAALAAAVSLGSRQAHELDGLV